MEEIIKNDEREHIEDPNIELQKEKEEQQYSNNGTKEAEKKFEEQMNELDELRENGTVNVETKTEKLAQELKQKIQDKALVGMNLDEKSEGYKSVMGFFAKYGLVKDSSSKLNDLIENSRGTKKKLDGIYNSIDLELRGNVKKNPSKLGGLYQLLRQEANNRVSIKKRIEGTISAIETAVTLQEQYKEKMSSGEQYEDQNDPYVKYVNQGFAIEDLQDEQNNLKGEIVRSNRKKDKINKAIKSKKAYRTFVKQLVNIADQPEENDQFGDNNDKYMMQLAPIMGHLSKDIEKYDQLKSKIEEAEHGVERTAADVIGECPTPYLPNEKKHEHPLEGIVSTQEAVFDEAKKIMEEMGDKNQHAYDLFD